MKLIVDRIEEGFAVLEKEDLTHILVRLCELPEGLKEGSVLDFDGENYSLNSDAESERRKRISVKHKMIFKKK